MNTENIDHKYIAHLESQLKEAHEVIDFYANHKHWLYPGKDYHNFAIAKSDTDRVERSHKKDTVSCGGRRARSYNKKFNR